jgi:hypothetical protein
MRASNGTDLSSERAPHMDRTVTFQPRLNIWSWAPDGARHQDRQTDWLSVAMWLWLWVSITHSSALDKRSRQQQLHLQEQRSNSTHICQHTHRRQPTLPAHAPSSASQLAAERYQKKTAGLTATLRILTGILRVCSPLGFPRPLASPRSPGCYQEDAAGRTALLRAATSPAAPPPASPLRKKSPMVLFRHATHSKCNKHLSLQCYVVVSVNTDIPQLLVISDCSRDWTHR